MGSADNQIAPGRRPVSSMTPVIVFREGKPFLLTGSPGGSRIITTNLQLILNVLAHGMNIADAAAAPRMHHQWYPDVLQLESGFSPDTIRILRARGHEIRFTPAMGSLQIAMFRDGLFYGYSDPRRPVAIGDIHGNIAALQDLLETVVPELTEDDTLVFLGDYVDRGADTKACVEEILRLEREASFCVVALLGNHEEWMLATMHDYARHSWLFNIEAFDTIASYSPEAAERLRKEMESAGAAMLTERIRLPYNLFFDALPQTHVEFFENLKLVYRSEDVLCVHGGSRPGVESVEAQNPRDNTWGCDGFPERYHGEQAVVYGHKNHHDVDESGWPMPHILDNATFGIDTISSGVLTAVRFPDRRVFQSRRFRQARHSG